MINKLAKHGDDSSSHRRSLFSEDLPRACIGRGALNPGRGGRLNSWKLRNIRYHRSTLCLIRPSDQVLRE